MPPHACAHVARLCQLLVDLMSPAALLKACQCPTDGCGSGGGGGRPGSAAGGGGSGRAAAQGITLSADICRAVTAGLRATAGAGGVPGSTRSAGSDGCPSSGGSGVGASASGGSGSVTPSSSLSDARPWHGGGYVAAPEPAASRPLAPALTPPTLLGSLSCAWSVAEEPSPGSGCGLCAEQRDAVVLQVRTCAQISSLSYHNTRSGICEELAACISTHMHTSMPEPCNLMSPLAMPLPLLPSRRAGPILHHAAAAPGLCAGVGARSLTPDRAAPGPHLRRAAAPPARRLRRFPARWRPRIRGAAARRGGCWPRPAAARAAGGAAGAGGGGASDAGPRGLRLRGGAHGVMACGSVARRQVRASDLCFRCYSNIVSSSHTTNSRPGQPGSACFQLHMRRARG